MKTLIIILYFCSGLFIGRLFGIKETSNKYFVDNSEEVLKGYNLNLPEELTEVNSNLDSTYNLLSVYKDPKLKTIFVRFDTNKIINPRDYQIELRSDNKPGFSLYDGNRLVEDFTIDIHNPKSGQALDNALLDDNL